MVSRRSRRVTLIDVEHARRRSRWYDRLVYGMKSRWRSDLACAVERVLQGHVSGPLAAMTALPRAKRHSLLAVFVLEELLWYLQENVRGKYIALSEGFQRFFAETGALSKLFY
jgi:hypothetical protein